MKSFIFLMFSMIILTTAFSQTSSPCNDQKFIELRKKGIENLSESEIAYYTQKEKECDQFTKSIQNNASNLENVNRQINQKNKSEEEYRAAKSKKTFKAWFWFITIFGVLGYFAYQHDYGK